MTQKGPVVAPSDVQRGLLHTVREDVDQFFGVLGPPHYSCSASHFGFHVRLQLFHELPTCFQRHFYKKNNMAAHGIAETMEQLLAGMRALVAERDALVVERDALVVERDALVAERDALRAERVALPEDLARTVDSVAHRVQKLCVAEVDDESDEDVREYVRVEPAEPELPTAAARPAKRPRGDDALSAKLAAEISKELGEMEEKYRVAALQKVENGDVRRAVVNIINGSDPDVASITFANPVAATVACHVYATLGLQCRIYGSIGVAIMNAREWYDANK